MIAIGDGGARRVRTDDLMLAKHALSQLSYGPILVEDQNVSWYYAPKHHELLGPKAHKPDRAPALMHGQPRRRMSPPASEAKYHGGPGTTRTSDLTLIRGAL